MKPISKFGLGDIASAKLKQSQERAFRSSGAELFFDAKTGRAVFVLWHTQMPTGGQNWHIRLVSDNANEQYPVARSRFEAIAVMEKLIKEGI